MKDIFLDTETTGLRIEDGHRIIEVGAVVYQERHLVRDGQFHEYLNPKRKVDKDAVLIHGLDDEFLSDKPKFGEIADRLISFLEGNRLLIHNAPFDVAFLDAELARLKKPKLESFVAEIVDTLEIARAKFPGGGNSLDALCRRFKIDISERSNHGALVDSKLLAEAYLAMTRGQVSLDLEMSSVEPADLHGEDEARADLSGVTVASVVVTPEEERAHEQRLDEIAALADVVLWRGAPARD